MELKDEIRQYRRINGYSQAKFSELCGVSYSAVSRIENGKGGLRYSTAKKIRDVLGSGPCENGGKSIQLVSTRERLPEVSGKYLARVACIHDGMVERVTTTLLFRLRHASWEIDGQNVVTYWAELPEPPKDEWL